jgi:Protein of unknown function (DUF1579)
VTLKSRILAAIAVLCFSCLSFAQQSDDPMMKAWMAYATPGDVHKAMSNLVGTWNTTIRSYMNPGEPTDQKGSSTYESVMDGRYLVEKAEGDFQGMPFQGMGIYGYDNGMKKYVSTWVDNMGTGIMTGTGTSDDNGKTINWMSKGFDPMSGKEQNYRSVMQMMTADQYHFEMYGPGPDGKELKMMEITYDRKK